MGYFTWKENGLTSDCSSLESMAARFEEASSLMRRMSKAGFKVIDKGGKKLIIHENRNIFKEWGFITEESPNKQLDLIDKDEE